MMRFLKKCTALVVMFGMLFNLIAMLVLQGSLVYAAGAGQAVFVNTPPGKKLLIDNVSASDSPEAANIPENVLDYDLDSRWSAAGDQWLMAELGDESMISGVGMAFYLGDTRAQKFDIEISVDQKTWVKVFSGQATGLTTGMQYLKFTPVSGKYVRIDCHGTTAGDWNSINQLEIYDDTGEDTSSITDSQTPSGSDGQENSGSKLKIKRLSVSNTPEAANNANNAIDGDLATRWSSQGKEEWMIADMGSICAITSVGMAFYQGKTRSQIFDIQISTDKKNWSTVFSGQASGQTEGMQYWKFNETAGRYVRIYCKGTTVGDWNSINELEIYGTMNTTDDGKNTVGINKELALLSVLNIINGYLDGTVQEEQEVTRAQLAQIAVRMLGLEETAWEGDSLYDDVSSNEEYYRSIMIASKLGLLKGYEGNDFKPSDSVTYEQAVKVMVTATGYGIIADNKGGYPAGYLSIAATTGITKNVSGSLGEPIKLGALVRMVKNTLEVNLLKQETYGDDNKMSSETGETLLSNNLHIKKHQGIVTANADTSLVGNSDIKEDEVKLDSRYIYKVGSTNIAAYLGYKVVFYTKETDNGDMQTVVYFYDEDTSTLKVKAEDINVDKISAQVFAYEKEENGVQKEETVSLVPNVSVIYNGKFSFSSVVDMLTFSPKWDQSNTKLGEITLVDNDNDGVYDVAFVNKYNNYVVKTKDSVNYTISSRYGAEMLTLDETKEEPKIVIYYEDEPVNFDEINVNDVLAVYEDEKKTLIKVIISRDTVSGSVQEVENDDKVVINGETYEFSKSYSQSTSSEIISVNLDHTGTFYLDIEGKIAAVDVSASSTDQYGFLTQLAVNSGVASETQVRIYTSNGALTIFELAEKVIFNGVRMSRSQVLGNPLFYDTSAKKPVRQLIKYNLDGQGKICKITTPKNYDEASDSDKESLIRNDEFRKTTQADLRYNSVYGAFYNNGEYDYLTGAVKVLQVPRSDQYYSDSDQYFTNGWGLFKNNTLYNVELYDFDTMMTPKIVVYYCDTTTSDSIGIDYNAALLIFDSLASVINADGERTYKLYYYDNGSKQSKEVSTKYTINALSNLKFGDAFLMKTNSKNQVVNIEIVLPSSSSALKDPSIGGSIYGDSNPYDTGRQCLMLKGVVIDHTGGEFIKLNISSPGIDRNPMVQRYGGNCYIINIKNKTVKSGTNADIAIGSSVVFRINKGRPSRAYIYTFD